MLVELLYEIIIWVGFVDFISVLDLQCNPSYRFHLKSKWWTIVVQLTKGTSCRQMRLCCQFYKCNINSYLKS